MAQKHRVIIVRTDLPATVIHLLEEKCDLTIYQGTGRMPEDELLTVLPMFDGVILDSTYSVNRHFLDVAGTKLKAIGTMSVGVEHIDVEECKKRGVTVGNTPEILTNAVAEFTVALLLATTRRLTEGVRYVKRGEPWSPQWMLGMGLTHSTVGIVGLGRIGKGVLKRLQAFNVKRFVYNDLIVMPEADTMGAKFVSFDELLSQSDFVICNCSLNKDNKQMFNKDAFSKMKRSSVFVNTGRGGLVDQDALYEALTTGGIRAAGLDVASPEPLPTSHSLLSLDNCVITPHMATYDVRTRSKMAELAALNVLAGLEGKTLPTGLW
jgi:glyoxylate/hydroxypyruvate reductase